MTGSVFWDTVLGVVVATGIVTLAGFLWQRRQTLKKTLIDLSRIPIERWRQRLAEQVIETAQARNDPLPVRIVSRYPTLVEYSNGVVVAYKTTESDYRRLLATGFSLKRTSR